jgi:O-acetyl-ADP-ribose deacetylase (regulator of RNase III)
MVVTKVGDLFRSNAQTWVNTINTVGIMGKGVALEFKKRFPEMYDDYVERCRQRKVRLGQPYLYRRASTPWVLNFPTKDHWRSVSKVADIVAGLEYLERHYQEWGVTSLAVPPLGCGNGGLDWRVVGPLLHRHFSRFEIPIELFAPAGTPVEQLQTDFLGQMAGRPAAAAALPGVAQNGRPPLNLAWVALVEIVRRIHAEPYHWSIGRTSFQKIAYFATEAGLPTGLQHRRGSYGPFADALKAVTTQLVNNGLLVEERRGEMLAVQPGPTYRDAAKAFGGAFAEWEDAIERVADLFLRMRAQDAEIAATVKYAFHDLVRASPERPTELEVLHEVMRWKQRRKPPLDEREVAGSIRHLNLLGWIEARLSTDLPVEADEAMVA